MTNINQVIWKILQSDIAIQKDLSRKVINMRALAKYLIKKHSLRVSLDAVISAIRRFQSQEVFEEEDSLLLATLKDSLISTKNNVSCVTVSDVSPDTLVRVCKIAEKNHHVRLALGSREVKVYVENRDLDETKHLLAKPGVNLKVVTGLSQISIVASEAVANMKGVAARITSEISLGSINIVELLICQPEFIIYVKESDTVKAHNSLLQLCSGYQR